MTTTGTYMRMSTRLLGLAALVAAAVSCGDVIRDGRSPGVLVMVSLQGASGGGHAANTFGSILQSDVIVLLTTPAPCTPVAPCPTTFSDSGLAVIGLVMKNITIAPTTNNQVTITRYRVSYRRTDGRNTPGVDVPFPFEGGATATVPPGGQVTMGFELVRHVAKAETPLVQLVSNRDIITTIADVTFYGKDLVGNDVLVTGSIQIDFGNFGDT
jgi:hypothetical protein